MDQNQLADINSKLEAISNHQDFFKKKMLAIDKIETALLGNEYSKKGIIHLVDDHESRIQTLEDKALLTAEGIKENSKKIEGWDKAIVAIIVAVMIFEITKHFIK